MSMILRRRTRSLALLAMRRCGPLTEALEHLVGDLLLRIRHRVVERIERRNRVLQSVDMRLAGLRMTRQVLHRGHALRGLSGSFRGQFLHGGGYPHAFGGGLGLVVTVLLLLRVFGAFRGVRY